jgi:hypothetical protein
MTLKYISVLAAFAACAVTTVLAQEQAATVTSSPNDASSEKQCVDKADYDKLAENLRSTFMLECVASAKLNIPQDPTTQK